MTIVGVGDRALAVLVAAETAEAATARVRGIAAAVDAATIAGVVDIVPSPDRVTVVYDPLRIASVATIREAVALAAAAANETPVARPGVCHEIPVCYGGDHGPDLEEVCLTHGLARPTLVALHTEPEYLVQAIGFLPGFGYLAGLDPRLVTPRRGTPRLRVPAGSVGIGGPQTGVYPFASPGGWNILGMSPARLFDAARVRPSLLEVGDRVRFVEITPDELLEPRRGEAQPPRQSADVPGRSLTVLQPGLFTTIQDLGRPGYRAAGVPLSGAADAVSLRLANLLVGNREDAAAIEVTLLGPDIRFEAAAVVAVTGGEFPGLPSGRPLLVSAGDVVRMGHAVCGCRGYLAINGGIRVDRVLGSASTFTAARFGGINGQPLAAGDRVPLGPSDVVDATALRHASPVADGLVRPARLRMIPGEQSADYGEAIWSMTHRTSSRSDRMGVRLEGEPLGGGLEGAGSMRSVAVLPGTVQVPPDGQPIVLLADAQTIGGYPVIGHVIAADLPVAAQLRPGDLVCWRQATIEEAHQALRDREAAASVRFGLTRPGERR